MRMRSTKKKRRRKSRSRKKEEEEAGLRKQTTSNLLHPTTPRRRCEERSDHKGRMNGEQTRISWQTHNVSRMLIYQYTQPAYFV